MSVNTDYTTIGSKITFICSSDLYPVRLEWYRDNSLLLKTSYATGDVLHLINLNNIDLTPCTLLWILKLLANVKS